MKLKTSRSPGQTPGGAHTDSPGGVHGLSDDRSSKLTAPALKAYNKALKSEYGHYELRRGRTLPEGFTIVKVSAHVWPMRCECE